jgi:hypothetical protein
VKGRAAPQTATGGVERGSTVEGPPSESLGEQYSLAKILGIWAAAALLIGLLAWVIGPTIISHLPPSPDTKRGRGSFQTVKRRGDSSTD